ncbi:glycosyltransferase family 4 protein [bacterium]|nr:glycosyltransferase family 4 protein [bacterium]
MGLRTLHVTTIDLTAHCFLRTTFDHLRRAGHQVALACTFQRFQAELDNHTDYLFPVAIPRHIHPLSDAIALVQLLKIIRDYRPDVIHTHTSKAGFVGRLAACLGRVPLIIHSIYELPQNSTRSNLKKRFYWGLEKLAASWCHHLITISRVNERQILSEGICAPPKLSFIPVGLTLKDYQSSLPRQTVRKAWGLPEQAVVLGMAARLEPVKGHSDLLQAFSLLAAGQPHLHLMLMGLGPLRPNLERQIERLGLVGRVHLLGWVDDLITAIAALDVFVFSSHYEGLGVVLLEALALGVPVVSTRVGGTQDIIENEITGLFAPPHQPQQLASAIQRMLDDPSLARRLALAGQSKVRLDYRAEDADQKILDLYLRLSPK